MQLSEITAVREQAKKCVRCGQCRAVCPVFAEIKNETAAPRGQVFLVQALRDGEIQPSPKVLDKLGNCLLCETCSQDCPSGIEVHRFVAAARSFVAEQYPSPLKKAIFGGLWTKPAMLRTLVSLLWGYQASGLQKLSGMMGLNRLLPGDLHKAEKILSQVPARPALSRLASVTAARGTKKSRIGYFLGCATNLLLPDVALATVDVLTRLGFEVVIPPGLKCCGMPQVANGEAGAARDMARANIELFHQAGVDLIVTDCGSCSCTLTHEYREMFSGTAFDSHAKAFTEKVRDLSAFLAEEINRVDGEVPPVRVTYHDPCHLRKAQKVIAPPRHLLKLVNGVELVEMAEPERCCGGSGTYALTHYDLSMKILSKKMTNVKATGAEIVATCCPSCTVQLRHGLNISGMTGKVVHPVELVSEAFKSAGRIN